MVDALVFRGFGTAVAVEPITLRPPGPTGVRVRIAAAGVCHSDLSMVDGVIHQDVPAVLGHEASGTVVEVGEQVRRVGVGDRVILNWSPACRRCWYCEQGEPYLCEHAGDLASVPYADLDDGTPVLASLGTGAFAQETVVDERAVVPLPAGLPLDTAAVLGCAVLTGVGAVVNSARVQAGQSVAVFGLGGIGLSAVQGARLSGAEPIVAVDTAAHKESVAREAGASDFLLASKTTPAEIRELTGGRGVDHAFECVGSAAVMRQAWSATRRGGHATIVGLGRRDDELTFNAIELPFFARTLRGTMFGSSDPERDLPKLADLVGAGRLDLDLLLSERIGLDGIADALDRMRRSEVVRSLVVFDDAALA